MIARYVAVGLFACMVSFSTQAQRSLDSLVSEANAEWMFGQWQTQTDSGDSVTLNISWELDKKVTVLHVKAPDMESKGYTVIEPNAEMPKYYSFDNKGSVGKGSWGMEGSELVLRVESESADRGPRKVGFIFSGSASEGLKVTMHTIGSSGDLETPARMTLKFKKQK
jgi:hypothetical protein